MGGKISRTGIIGFFFAYLLLLAVAPVSAQSSEETLIVAGAPPIHETTLPHLSTISSRLISRPIFEHLADVDPITWDYTRPMLAERWEMSEDAKTWTFYLRQGVSFHDGWGELSAEDVKFSLELLLRQDAINSTASLWRQLIDRIEVVDPLTVRLVLTESNPDVLFELSSWREVQILSKK